MPTLVVAVYLISILATLSLGLVVFFQNPNHKVNRVFASFIIAILGWQITLFAFYSSQNAEAVLILGRLNFVFAQLIAFTLLNFCSYFPTGERSVSKKILIILGFVTLALSTITLFSPLIVENEVITGSISRDTVVGRFYPLFALQFLTFTFGGIFLLLRKYRKFSGLYKQQTLYLLAGFFLGICFGTFTNIVFPVLFRYFDLQNVGLLAPLIFVSFASYAIIKHRLLDIHILVARTISYSLLVLIIGGIFSFGIFFFGYYLFPNASSAHNLVISTIYALILSFTFQPLRKLIESLTDRYFYKGKYSSQEVLKSLSKLLLSTYHVEELINNVLSDLAMHLKVSRGKIVLVKRSSVYLQTSVIKGDIFSPLANSEIDALIKESKRSLILFEETKENQLKEIMRKYSIRVVVPLVTKDKFIGLIILGEKLSGDNYSDQDIKLLDLFSPELSIAVQNAEAYEEISQFNITLREEVDSATENLRKANHRLRELDKLKDEFVSLASHELRTPLTAIKYYVWMTLHGKGGALQPKQKGYLDRAYLSTTRLTKLVNDMLNISRIEPKRVILNPFKTQLHKLALDVADEIHPKAKEAGVKITVSNRAVAEGSDKQVGLPAVLADRDKIKEVLINLVGNSLKFTPKDGTIKIWFEVNHDFVRVNVTDSGIGFDPHKRDQLFKKFGMIRESYSAYKDASQGTGLGLYICKSIINLHGGDMSAHSEGLHHGATFAFTLPIYSKKLHDDFQKRFAGKTDAGIIMTQVMAE